MTDTDLRLSIAAMLFCMVAITVGSLTVQLLPKSDYSLPSPVKVHTNTTPST